MKRTLLILVLLLFITSESFAVKHVAVKTTEVKFHNFSSGPFDATNMKMTINGQWFALNALILISGSLNVPAGMDVVVGGFTLPLNGASLALWYGSVDECNPSPFDMASFVQYGYSGQTFESVAVAANLWAAGEFVHGGPPLTRDADWSSDGASHWTGTILSIAERPILQTIEIGPIPFKEELIVQTNQTSAEYSVEIFDVLGYISYQRNAIKEEELEINTELFKQGVYFVRISDSKGASLTRRIVKDE